MKKHFFSIVSCIALIVGVLSGCQEANATGTAETDMRLTLDFVLQYYQQRVQEEADQNYFLVRSLGDPFVCPATEDLLEIIQLDKWEETVVDATSEEYQDQLFFRHALEHEDGLHFYLYIGETYGAIESYVDVEEPFGEDATIVSEVMKDGVYFRLPQKETKEMVLKIADYANQYVDD